MKKAPERYRIVSGSMSSDESYGNNGMFLIPLSKRSDAAVIISDKEDWEHVSVHIRMDEQPRTPTWAEMCKIKDIFWEKDEVVIQYHPAESEYVNTFTHCLHLWKPLNIEIPTPPIYMV